MWLACSLVSNYVEYLPIIGDADTSYCYINYNRHQSDVGSVPSYIITGAGHVGI